MFVETCCPKCGKNSAYIRNYSHDTRTFSCCNNCGGFSFIPGFHLLVITGKQKQNKRQERSIKCIRYVLHVAKMILT